MSEQWEHMMLEELSRDNRQLRLQLERIDIQLTKLSWTVWISWLITLTALLAILLILGGGNS